MDNQAKQQDSAPREGPADAPAPALGAPEAAPADPWLTFLIEEKASARKFVSGLRKGPIRVPGDAARQAFAAALFDSPGRVKRLLSLMRESVLGGEPISRIVFELAEAAIRHISALVLPVPLSDANYHTAVNAWLDGFPKRPLKPQDLQVLILLLHFGLHRRLLSEEGGMGLVASAVQPAPKRGGQRSAAPKPAPSPMDVVLAATPAAPVLGTLVAHAEAWRRRSDAQDRLLQSQADEIARLSAACSERAESISELRAAIGRLEAENAAAAAKVADLEKEMQDLSDGWQHKLDDVRGRIRGTMSGQLTRWVQTALDAARSDPPFAQVIEQRLEDTLRLIEREVQWLQPSA